ncbi:Pycsar system effector family protein [Kocuria flava]|uniref:Pycsar system effector family protein n=1 Tax=Kocuria flava TaxID=446860 RepID=UPI00117BF664|nr:Pycsar system effector family protein [Kocuria flava]
MTLAFVGATGTMLYSLVKNLQDWGWFLGVAAVVCGIALFIAAAFGFMALFPRTTPHSLRQEPRTATESEDTSTSADEEAVNLLFYGDITRRYANDRPTFLEVFSALTSNEECLTAHIAHQIHANAHIATTKFHWVNLAIKTEAVAVGALAIVAFIVGK